MSLNIRYASKGEVIDKEWATRSYYSRHELQAGTSRGANNSISQDINKIKLPRAIKQGTGIPLKSFYKLYGDGKNIFKGITK